MVISEIQHIIDQLEQALPKAFVFVLDTTDRSFLYKSSDRHDCSEHIIQIDQELGIDKVTKGLNYFTLEKNQNWVYLKKLDPNSFLGVCVLHGEYDKTTLEKIENILSN